MNPVAVVQACDAARSMRELASEWLDSVESWRRIIADDPLAAALSYCAGVLLETVERLENSLPPIRIAIRRPITQRRQSINKLRQRIIERDASTCQICRSMAGPWEIDHRVPRSRGGSDDESNLWLLCRDCNQQKRAQTVEEFLAALHSAGIEVVL